MDITDVKIFKAQKRGAVLAYANVIINNEFIIRGITLIETEKGRFLSMPSRKLRDSKTHYRDICHPLNSNIRNDLNNIVFDAYEEFINSEK